VSEHLSRAQARRIALAAQGFGEPRPDGPIDARRIARTVRRLGLLQIDSVNVLARAHYVPLFSRLGPYPTALLDAAAWGRPRRLFEYWAHEASLLPVETQPLMRWRMHRARRQEGIYGGLARFARERADYLAAVLAAVTARGPTTAGDLEGAKGAGGWWGWSEPKRALECLFWEGRLTTATRRGFERVYDLPERVLPPAVLAAPDPHPADAHRHLIAHAARALGVATATDLRDYFRFARDEGTAAIAELVEAGKLIPVRVEGWTQKAWRHRDARLPRRIAARALLSPFDPLIWERARTERLFGFRYRIEIYTPAEKRVHGYYVLPFLLGDALVARVDLKADRAAGVLRVQSAHAEPDAPPDTAEALRAELRTMADWLGLERVAVAPVGDLAGAVVGVEDRRSG
jgi:uncharacterized protein